jgi:heat shock protein HtpX
MRGNLEKRGLPAPLRSAVLAFLLVGGLLLLMLFCGRLYAGLSGAVITTVLGAIALMLVRKVSPQFFLLLSGARSIGSEDMPALSSIIDVLCQRAGITQVPGLYFLPSGVPTAFATGVGDRSVIVVSSGLLRLLMTRELTGGVAHEITHIVKHDVELMQLARIVGQMTRLIAQVAIIIAIATWLLDVFGSGEGVDWLSLGMLVAAPIVANLILGALSRQREYQADLEAVALTDDPAGLARAIELIEMAQKRIASGARAVRIRLPRLLSSHPDPKDRIHRLRQSVAEEPPPDPDERSPYRTISRTSERGGCRLPSELGAGRRQLGGSIGETTTFGSRDDALCIDVAYWSPMPIRGMQCRDHGHRLRISKHNIIGDGMSSTLHPSHR